MRNLILKTALIAGAALAARRLQPRRPAANNVAGNELDANMTMGEPANDASAMESATNLRRAGRARARPMPQQRPRHRRRHRRQQCREQHRSACERRGAADRPDERVRPRATDGQARPRARPVRLVRTGRTMRRGRDEMTARRRFALGAAALAGLALALPAAAACPAVRHRSGLPDRADRGQRPAGRPAAAGRDPGRISRPSGLEPALGAQRRRAAMPVLALSAHGRHLQCAARPPCPRARRRLYRARRLFPPGRRPRRRRQFRPLFDPDLQQFLDPPGPVRLLPDRGADRQGSARPAPRASSPSSRPRGCANCAAA